MWATRRQKMKRLLQILPLPQLALFMSSTFWAVGQTAPNVGARLDPRDAVQASCWEKTDFRSHFAHSRSLFSPDQRHRAYVQVTAKAYTAPDIPKELFNEACQNTSKLFVGDANATRLRSVFQLGSSSFRAFGETWASDGNGMRIVDWSPSGRYLLVELSLWKYETEGQNRIPLHYDVKTGKIQMANLYSLFEKRFGSKCEVDFQMEGFSHDNQPIVLASPPQRDHEFVPCVNRKERFELQFGENQLKPVSPSTPSKQYGTVLGGAKLFSERTSKIVH